MESETTDVDTEDYSGNNPMKSSLHYIEQELQGLGLPSLMDSDKLNETKALCVLQKLLLLHRHNLQVIEDQRDCITRGKSDLIIQREAQARLKDDIKSSEKELGLLEDKERQLIQKVKVLSSKLRAEQDEVRRLKINMQYKATQRIHESKKQEREFERLKLKLGQLVSDKSNERRLGLSMPNALQKADGFGKRKTWIKPGSGDKDMYHVIISNYEERQKELVLENASLRESLAGMEKQLICVLNEKQATLQNQNEETKKEDDADEQAATNGVNTISSGHFQMPYDIVRDGIEQNFLDKCQLVKKHIDDLKLRIERLEASPGEDYVDSGSEISKLEHKLSDYRNIIGQQEEMLLQKSLNPEEDKPSELLSESCLWKEKTQLEQERHLFLEQRESFERERQKYMEAVCEFDRERRNFEGEKLRDPGCLLNSTQELDSFFTKLCSTPSQTSSERSLSKYASATTRLSSSSLLQDSITENQDVDLRHDLSMCSDDGTSVLN